MLNPYGFIPVNPDLHLHVKYEAVLRFGGFLTSEYGQSLIAAYRKNDAVLFHPAFRICDETHDCPTTTKEISFWAQYQGVFAALSI